MRGCSLFAGSIRSFMIYHNPGRNIDAMQLLVEMDGRAGGPVKVGRVGHADEIDTFELDDDEHITMITGAATKRYSFVNKLFVAKDVKDRLPTGTDAKNYHKFSLKPRGAHEQIFCSLRDFFNPLFVADQLKGVKVTEDNPTHDLVFSVVVKGLQVPAMLCCVLSELGAAG
jgi:hypothetical protein